MDKLFKREKIENLLKFDKPNNLDKVALLLQESFHILNSNAVVPLAKHSQLSIRS